ncbi:uncharacterized protein si:dkey-22i16.9 [Siniperca chuatsi]|uniref:uncharacterized protein si:dkey-22i16.9 n=1 Tax=Siniperca chuatsi TaxID=119488 RepID=UPI001CE0A067|nr:uncharacterized protein si:dkey-22i16.9 [Siniperca chuatsi]
MQEFTRDLFTSPSLSRVSGQRLTANIGDSVDLITSENCKIDEEFKLMTHDSSRTVATLVNGVWTPAEGYKGRIKHNATYRVVLTDVNYNDNGLYEFTCGRHVVSLTELEVLPFEDVDVTEGETVTLPCYAFTAREPAEGKPPKWERNGELVAEPNFTSREIRYGTGFEGRVTVSSDWSSKGDLSLTLEGVKLEDQGDFICHGHDKKGERKTVAMRLRVSNPSNPDQTACPPVSPRQTEMGTWTIVCIIAVCFVALSATGFGWWLKSRRSNGPAAE